MNWDLIIDPVLKEGAGKVFEYILAHMTPRDKTIDLSGGEPISSILQASVTAKKALASDPVLLRLQRVDPPATIDLFMIPTEKITVRLPRGTYVATALLLREPQTFSATDKPVIIGLGRKRVPVASSKTQRLRISIAAPSPKVLAELAGRSKTPPRFDSLRRRARGPAPRLTQYQPMISCQPSCSPFPKRHNRLLFGSSLLAGDGPRPVRAGSGLSPQRDARRRGKAVAMTTTLTS